MKYLCWKFSFCKRCRSKNSQEKIANTRLPYKDKKFNKARGRLIEELDIVRLIFMLRNMEVTQRVLF